MATCNYRYQTASVAGFLAQLVRYVAAGHYFYITGVIPERKAPQHVDAKLLDLYDVAKPKWRRARRHRNGVAGIHYLRHGRFFVLIATHGRHRFFQDHAANVRDIRRTALHLRGYSVRYTYSERENRWKVSVRLDHETYADLRAHFLQLAVRPSYRNPKRIEAEFRALVFQPYLPVRQQLLAILKAANRRRRYLGYALLSSACIPEMRRLEKVFLEDAPEVDEVADD